MTTGRLPTQFDTLVNQDREASSPGRRMRLSDLTLGLPGEPRGSGVMVRVAKGGALEIEAPAFEGVSGGIVPEGGSDPAHVALLRQFYPQLSVIPAPPGSWLPVVYGFDVGNIAGTTTSAQNTCKVANSGLVAAYCMGTFNDAASGVYVKNRSRWDLYRNANYHIAGEDVTSTSTVKGTSDLLTGNALDRLIPLLAPWKVTGGQTMGLDIRNEGATQLYHDMILYALQAYDTEPLPAGDYELFFGTIRFASTDFTGASAGPKGFPFQLAGGSWLIALLGHAEAGAAAITHTALQMKASISEGPSGLQFIGGSDQWITDQLLFGANGQRPFVFPTPMKLSENAQLTIELNSAITGTGINYEVTGMYLARRQSGG